MGENSFRWIPPPPPTLTMKSSDTDFPLRWQSQSSAYASPVDEEDGKVITIEELARLHTEKASKNIRKLVRKVRRSVNKSLKEIRDLVFTSKMLPDVPSPDGSPTQKELLAAEARERLQSLRRRINEEVPDPSLLPPQIWQFIRGQDGPVELYEGGQLGRPPKTSRSSAGTPRRRRRRGQPSRGSAVVHDFVAAAHAEVLERLERAEALWANVAAKAMSGDALAALQDVDEAKRLTREANEAAKALREKLDARVEADPSLLVFLRQLPTHLENLVTTDVDALALFKNGGLRADTAWLVNQAAKINGLVVHAAQISKAKGDATAEVREIDGEMAKLQRAYRRVKPPLNLLPPHVRAMATSSLSAMRLWREGKTDPLVAGASERAKEISDLLTAANSVREVSEAPDTPGRVRELLQVLVAELVRRAEDKAKELRSAGRLPEMYLRKMPPHARNLIESTESAVELWAEGRIDPAMCSAVDGLEDVRRAMGTARALSERARAGGRGIGSDALFLQAQLIVHDAESRKRGLLEVVEKYKTFLPEHLRAMIEEPIPEFNEEVEEEKSARAASTHRSARSARSDKPPSARMVHPSPRLVWAAPFDAIGQSRGRRHVRRRGGGAD